MSMGLAEKVKPSGSCASGESCSCGCGGSKTEPPRPPGPPRQGKKPCPGSGSCSCGCKTKKPGGTAIHPPPHPNDSTRFIDAERTRADESPIADILKRLEAPPVITPPENKICCLPPHRELRPQYSCWPCAQYLMARGRAGDWPFIKEPPQSAELREDFENLEQYRDRPVLRPVQSGVPAVATVDDGVAVCTPTLPQTHSPTWSRLPLCPGHEVPEDKSPPLAISPGEFRGKGGAAVDFCQCRCHCDPFDTYEPPPPPKSPGPEPSVMLHPEFDLPRDPGVDPKTGAAVQISGTSPVPNFPLSPDPRHRPSPRRAAIVVTPDSPSESNWESCPSCGLLRPRADAPHLELSALAGENGGRARPVPELGTRSFGSEPPLGPPLHAQMNDRTVIAAGTVEGAP